MDSDQLRTFLLAANKAGYASSGETKARKEPNGSKSLVFEQGDFTCHDNWFGGEPYGGMSVVFYKNKPVWMMTYYGTIAPEVLDFKNIYTVLRSALLQMPEEMPLRGPTHFSADGFDYKNVWDGTLDSYSGQETITKDGKEIYSAHYMGGLVDVRKE